MKGIFSIGLIILLSIFSGCTSQPVPAHKSVTDNQLQNSHFEIIADTEQAYWWGGDDGMYAYTIPTSNGRALTFPNTTGVKTVSQMFTLEYRGFSLAKVDAGLYKLKFGANQLNLAKKGDEGNIVVVFADKNHHPISVESIGYFNSYNKWTKREAIVPLPPKTRHILISFKAKKDSTSGKATFFDDAYAYIGTNFVVSKKEDKKHIITNPYTELYISNSKKLFVTQSNKVLVKDLKTDKILFEKQYSEKPEDRPNRIRECTDGLYVISLPTRTDVVFNNKIMKLRRGFRCLDNKYYYGEIPNEFNFHSNRKFDEKKLKYYYKIYDFKTHTLQYKFPVHAKVVKKKNDNQKSSLHFEHTTVWHYYDEKSEKIVFFETIPDRTSVSWIDDFDIKYVYIFDIKSGKGEKVSLLKKDKKFNSVFPVAYYIARNKKGEAVIYELSAQSASLDNLAKKATSAFSKYKEVLTGQDFTKILRNQYFNDPVADDVKHYAKFHIKGINLSTMKYKKLTDNHQFIFSKYNRSIDLKNLFDGFNGLRGSTVTKNCNKLSNVCKISHKLIYDPKQIVREDNYSITLYHDIPNKHSVTYDKKTMQPYDAPMRRDRNRNRLSIGIINGRLDTIWLEKTWYDKIGGGTGYQDKILRMKVDSQKHKYIIDKELYTFKYPENWTCNNSGSSCRNGNKNWLTPQYYQYNSEKYIFQKIGKKSFIINVADATRREIKIPQKKMSILYADNDIVVLYNHYNYSVLKIRDILKD